MSIRSVLQKKIRITPEINDAFILLFEKISLENNPEEMHKELFENPWFVDEDNNLVAFPSKYGEAESWFPILKEYVFTPLGFKLEEEPVYMQEYTCAKSESESYFLKFQSWKARVNAAQQRNSSTKK